MNSFNRALGRHASFGLAAVVLLGRGRFSADQAVLGDDHVIDLRIPVESQQRTPLSVG